MSRPGVVIALIIHNLFQRFSLLGKDLAIPGTSKSSSYARAAAYETWGARP
jgi:hypothetical protein